MRRRTVLRGAMGSGALALTLAACGGDDSKQTAGTGTSPGATAPSSAPLDSTKGKPGGKLIIQAFGDPGGIVLVKTRNAGVAQLAGFTHSGLYHLKSGRPIIDPTDPSVEPDLAQAMPEQPDELTYVVRLHPAKFQNGRTVTAEDVKYSYERYAFGADSAYKNDWTWLEAVEALDASTVVVKTKYPFGEAVNSMAAWTDAFIMAKEWEESPQVTSKLMGSGAFTLIEAQPPTLHRYKKNPDYFLQPYPYFDEVVLLGNSDFAKKVADFSTRQVHMTYWHAEEERTQIKQARPDAVEWRHGAPPHNVQMRVDQPPFNDKRVRQALSMAINRKEISDATTRGTGVPDQVLSSQSKFWGFRKPAELGEAAKYWDYNPAEAKKLLAAAGVTLPIQTKMHHWNASVIGQAFVDTATIVQSNWRANGIANVEDIEMTFAQSTSSYFVGNYDGTFLSTGGFITIPAFALSLRNSFSSPPEGVKAPTQNLTHVNDPQLTALVEKQVRQLNIEERKKTLREIEDILAEQQYRIGLTTYYYNYFTDPSLRNNQVPIFSPNNSLGYVKYWWFA
jgi:peptide/nickel transport system substrate-binding protein